MRRLAIITLIGAALVLLGTLAYLAPHCAPGDPAGPTLGRAFRLWGC